MKLRMNAIGSTHKETKMKKKALQANNYTPNSTWEKRGHYCIKIYSEKASRYFFLGYLELT